MVHHTRFDSRFGESASEPDLWNPSEPSLISRPSKGALLARLGELIFQAQKMLKAFDEGRSSYIGYVAILRDEKVLPCLVDIGEPAQEELRTIATLDLSSPKGLDEFYRKDPQDYQNDPEFQRLQREHDTSTPPKIRQLIDLLKQVRGKLLGIIPPDSDTRKGTTTAKTGPARKRPRVPQKEKNLSPSERCAHTTAKLITELGRLKPQMTGTEADYTRLKVGNAHFLAFRIAAKHPQLREKLLHLQSHTRYIRLAQELSAAHHGRELSTAQADWKKHKPTQYRNPKR